MKKPGLVLAALALVIVLILVLRWRPIGSSKPPAAAGARASQNLSPELRKYLYEPYTHIRVEPPQDIQAYTAYENKYGKFGSKGLRYVVDPEVKGGIHCDRMGATWASILDDFCGANNCQWEVADPKTIHIGVKK